jgi:hypothetical protein
MPCTTAQPRRAPRPSAWTIALALAAAALPPAARAQETHAAHGRAPAAADTGAAPLLRGLGRHHLPVVTRSPLAQRYFDQGLSLAYAFNHAEAARSFRQAARLDPTCAMCEWGVAFVLGPNINAPMDSAANAEAYRSAQRAVALAGRTTPRERAYAEALARRYAPRPPADRAPLDSAYAAAMQEVARRFPRDADAATLAAEARMTLSPWVYWAADSAPRAGTAEALADLDRAMRLNPSHPGACHFYIHAVEAVYPQRAVACAERLAALMPGAGHIVHMPAHIYLRVGRWNDAIAANEHAVHADERYIADQRVSGFYALAYYPHNHHFLAFAATMAGRREKAMTAARAAAAHTPADVALGAPDLQLLTAFPHLTLATFGRWSEVLAEPLPRGDLRLATGLAWYARGLAHAARGEQDQARRALDTVAASRAGVPAYPGAAVLQIATRALTGEIATRQGRHAAAVAELTEAARLEDALTYMEPPYWQRPVRHLLGAALLSAGRPAEAERRFAEDLRRFPSNIWSLRGLERSLVAPGRPADARAVRRQFRRAAEQADVTVAASRF